MTEQAPNTAKASTSSLLNRVALAAVFTISFATYLAPDLSVALQLAPLILFAALVLFKAFWSEELVSALTGFLETDGLLYIVLLSALMLESSFESTLRESFQFALLISVCLVFARVYMALVPLQEVFEAFYWSAIVSLMVLLPLSFEMIIHSLTTLERLFLFNFHPNLLALQLSGFLCAIVWKFMAGGWPAKIFNGLLGLICCVVIVLSSSRGAIVGVAAGVIFVVAIALTTSARQHRRRVLKASLLALALLAASLPFLQNRDATKDTLDAMDEILSLSSSERGLDSGMSGRFDLWHEALRVFKDGTWLLGNGVRSSDAAYTYPMIDNSYLVVLYDMGLFSLILITWRFLNVLGRMARRSIHCLDLGVKRLYMACGMFLVVLLFTSIVERSLFAVGNPFSLLAFLIFAAPTQLTDARQDSHADHLASTGLVPKRLATNT